MLIEPLTYVASGDVPSASAIVLTAPVGDSRLASPLPYWPSYGAASPAQRAVYLDWLAGVRADPAVPIGYVFIYFYGLEQRVLVDDCDHVEVRAELRRLLSVYGGDASFSATRSDCCRSWRCRGCIDSAEDELRSELSPTSG
ncbi:MAG: TerB N-terminal domain-containing protein [Myxococcales bacterium]|nr:TerB N-terminal domain-containing protein [Myxococcales bacterium]